MTEPNKTRNIFSYTIAIILLLIGAAIIYANWDKNVPNDDVTIA